MKKLLLVTACFVSLSVCANANNSNSYSQRSGASSGSYARHSDSFGRRPLKVASRPAAPRFESSPQSYYSAPPPPPQQHGNAPSPRTHSQQSNPYSPSPSQGSSSGLDIDGVLSVNMGVTSDYTFRGVSQTEEDPAIQGGIDYNHDSGAYVGLWASNVDFDDGDEATAEVDIYAGYSQEVAPNLTADGGVMYYTYPGADSALNYDFYELYAGLEYAWDVSGFDATSAATVNYSPDYFLDSGDSWYLAASTAVDVGYGVTVDGHLGHLLIEDEVAFAPDYTDWSLGIAYDLEGFEIKAQYIDTDVAADNCSDICDARGVISVSKSLDIIPFKY